MLYDSKENALLCCFKAAGSIFYGKYLLFHIILNKVYRNITTVSEAHKQCFFVSFNHFANSQGSPYANNPQANSEINFINSCCSPAPSLITLVLTISLKGGVLGKGACPIKIMFQNC